MPDAAELALNLSTEAECRTFIKNALDAGRPDLAIVARKRAIELRANARGAKTEIELDFVRAVLAYEEAKSRLSGRRTHASRTWPLLDRYGAVEAIERIVSRATDTMGFQALGEMDLLDHSFEAVVLRHKALFSSSAIIASETRLDDFKEAANAKGSS